MEIPKLASSIAPMSLFAWITVLLDFVEDASVSMSSAGMIQNVGTTPGSLQELGKRIKLNRVFMGISIKEKSLYNLPRKPLSGKLLKFLEVVPFLESF